ncbi:hypothetical protein TRAPUB_650 [Trametes pubescens]|uniref:F-box domain-containing protein n=1 Tax=Trametes pubescens TaxID=154538 RepID=A0A1M2VLK9_TRAPU|nr:hypothetical protein TRAPUB_650 [Trametes pubescens]
MPLVLQTRLPYALEDGKVLHEVLIRCTNLHTLDLQWCDKFLTKEPSVAGTIAMLPMLVHLSVSKHDNKSRPLLLGIVMNMQSSLRSLHLTVGEDDPSTADVLQGLARVHDRLVSLTLQFITFTAPGMAFAAIHTLNLIIPGWLSLP